MTLEDTKIIAGAINRTNFVNEMDKNVVRRKAKHDCLKLMMSDLIGQFNNSVDDFDEKTFINSIL